MTRLLASRFRSAAFAVLATLSLSQAAAAQEVNLYTTREPGLMQPLMDSFTKSTGIKVNSIFIKDGLAERVAAEGLRSPADVLMTVDIGALFDLVEKGLTQPVQSAVLERAVPANLRGKGGEWFALSLRARVLYVQKDLNLSSFTYEQLADPAWKGKICTRAGQHPYNTALIAAYIAHHGEAQGRDLAERLQERAGAHGDGRRSRRRAGHHGRHLRYRGRELLLRRPDAERSRRSRTAEVGRGDQGHPADVRGRRHARQHLRCVDREAARRTAPRPCAFSNIWCRRRRRRSTRKPTTSTR